MGDGAFCLRRYHLAIIQKEIAMKTLIVGTGVIGTIYGWALAEAGVDVTHYVRPGRASRYAAGVALDLLDERKGHKANNQTHYALHCTETVCPQDGYELVILPVNADQLSEALATLVPCAPHAVFLPLTSNWEGTQALDACLPRDLYLLGYADGGGTIRDGVYWANLGAEIHLGAVSDAATENLMRVKRLFERADMRPDVQANMLHWLWVHNATATPFAAGFMHYKEIKPFLKDGEMVKTGLHASQELLRLCEQRGANLKEYPEIAYMNWPDWMFLAVFRWLYTTNKSMQRYTAHAASAGSARETRANYAAMLRTADELGIAAPALRSLGKFLEE
jgi:2-dehydropantoate 2-reductase